METIVIELLEFRIYSKSNYTVSKSKSNSNNILTHSPRLRQIQPELPIEAFQPYCDL